MLSTARLVLRTWRDEDLVPFAALNADVEVMRHFPSVLTRDESDALAARIRSALSEHGLTHDAADDFDHPGLSEGHPLRRHVLYRDR